MLINNIGDELRRRREDLGITIKGVSDALKIKESDIVMLEQNSMKLITKNLYLEGFIKSYCVLLKVDQDIIKEYLKNIQNIDKNKKSKHQLINLEYNLNPNREYLINALIIFLIICLFLISLGQFEMDSSKLTQLIINQFNKID